MAVGAVVARILTQYSDKGSKAAQKDIAKMGKNFDAFAKKVGKAFAIAGAAAAAFAIKIGKDAVQAAMADQKSQVLLANSLRNTTGATNAAISTVEDYISKLQLQVGVADDELRPSLAKLAAVTGSVSAAQELLGTALDVSAFAGVDLGTATNAITRAMQGNFRTLQKLVPSLDAATIKSKDFGAILAEVAKATQGSAASRAGTLEYRLQIMRIRFGEILETLGYALLPVIEKFADTIQKKVLPQIEKFIKENKEGLVKGLQKAAEIAIKFIGILLSFSQWISENLGLIKVLAIAIAALFITSKIAAFIIGLQGVAVAFGLITIGANGATAATARFYKVAGGLLKFAKLAVGVLAVLSLSGSSRTEGGYPAGTVGAQNAKKDKLMKAAEKPLGNFQMSTGTVLKTPDVASADSALLDILKKLQAEQDKLNNKKNKALSIEQEIVNNMLKEYKLKLMTPEIEAKATAAAIKANQERQKLIAGSPTVSLAGQGDGSAGGNIMFDKNEKISVNIYTPYGMADDFVVDITNKQNQLAKRAGALNILHRTR